MLLFLGFLLPFSHLVVNNVKLSLPIKTVKRALLTSNPEQVGAGVCLVSEPLAGVLVGVRVVG